MAIDQLVNERKLRFSGDAYSEPIAKFHRGHSPHPGLPFLCVAFCLTSPDREHVTNVVQPW